MDGCVAVAGGSIVDSDKVAQAASRLARIVNAKTVAAAGTMGFVPSHVCLVPLGWFVVIQE